jgi:hypothetical protein
MLHDHLMLNIDLLNKTHEQIKYLSGTLMVVYKGLFKFYTHRISYAWERSPLLQVEHRTILLFRPYNIVSQLINRKGQTLIHHSRLTRANKKGKWYGGKSTQHPNYQLYK